MLAVLQTSRVLRLTRPGRLLPWLGPALRGLVARRLKAQVCRHPPAEQETHWRYCKGCPFMNDCPYGQTLEAAPPAGVPVFTGQEDAARPVVLAPLFPAPTRGAPGLEVPLRVTLGRAAALQVRPFWAAVAAAGQDAQAGIDPDNTTYELLPAAACAPQWRQVELPLAPDSPAGILPRLRIELTAPLFIRTASPAGRRLVLQPSFADLFRAALRTLGQLFALYDQRLPADFAALKAAAQEVPTLAADYRPFRQPRWSNRTGQGGLLRGITGSGTYAHVPLALARWLHWGGLLHLGTHRVAGAGSCRLWSSAGHDDWQEWR